MTILLCDKLVVMTKEETDRIVKATELIGPKMVNSIMRLSNKNLETFKKALDEIIINHESKSQVTNC